MVDSNEIRQKTIALGADLCGIAPVERFCGAPNGFNPKDIWRKTKSVLVYAKQLPQSALFSDNCVPYTHANTLATQEVDRISNVLSLHLEKNGIQSIIIPSDDPYEQWDEVEQHGRAILSLRHAAQLAGLGNLGKNNLLINNQFGNMLQFGALLIATELEYDNIASYTVCPSGCSLCIDSCPVKALDGTTVIQKKCRPLSNFKIKKGYVLKKCWECRKVCPNALGLIRGN